MKAKNIIFYGFFAVMAALVFASCNPDPEPKPTHTHDYGAVWKSNSTQHWHECSCGDKTDIANHTSGDWIVDQAATATTAGSKHKECTVCGYETATEPIPATGEGHTHDYGTEWKSNATQHWRECSCGDKADVANHTGDPCTICGYASGNSDITYTAVQTGGTDGTANTTGIAFTFSASVTGLTADDISVTSGNGSVTKGALSGSGTSWTLGVTVTTAGNVTVAITKSGIEAETKDVTVFMEGQAAPTLTGITAVYNQTATVYPNTLLNDLKADLTVTATYSSGTPQPVTAYELSGTLTVGTSTVTVTYEGKETTFTVTVTATPAVKTLTGITLNTDTVIRNYNQNETLNLTGLIVTANYSDSTSAIVTYTSASPAHGSTFSTTGTITVTVNYTEGTITQSNTFTVTVTAVNTGTPGLSFTAIDNNTAYRVSRGTAEGAIVIPAYYRPDANSPYLPVTAISNGTDDYYNSAFGGIYGNPNTTVTSITFAENSQLTTISAGAFAYCTNLTAITIPAGVTSIDGTFNGCTRLTSVTFAAVSQLTSIGDGAFWDCNILTSVTIPEGVTSIGYRAFAACWGLTSITIPDSVTSIGEGAFLYAGQNGHASITIPASVTSVGTEAFFGWNSSQTIYVEGYSSQSQVDTAWGTNWRSNCNAVIVYVTGGTPGLSFTAIDNNTAYSVSRGTAIGAIVIPAYYRPDANSPYLPVTEIGNAFGGTSSSPNTTVTSIAFAEGSQLKTISNSAFAYCTSLASVTIPASVTEIGNSAFYGCTGLTSVTIEEGVMYIGNYAFRNCTGLTSITIPAGVTEIGGGAFYGCTGLTAIDVSSDNTTFKSLDGILYTEWRGDYTLLMCPAGKTGAITIPDSVWLTSIGFQAFYGCTGLTEITIPASVTHIQSRAFQDCTGLTTVTFEGTIRVSVAGEYSEFSSIAFPGDLRTKFYQGSLTYGVPGTYTRPDGESDTWTRQE